MGNAAPKPVRAAPPAAALESVKGRTVQYMYMHHIVIDY